MSTDELLALTEQTIAENPNAEVDTVDDRLMLTIPEPETHNGHRLRLFGDRGPFATIINGKDGRLAVRVSARRLRSYLVRP